MEDNSPGADFNPYLAPTTGAEEPVAATDAEVIRNKHIAHEASVKSIGFLYLLSAILVMFGVIVFFTITLSVQQVGRGYTVTMIGVLSMLITLAIIQPLIAWGFYKLRPWARIVAGVLSAIGLIGFPLGTLINAYILYLLFSAKGAMVFSEEYKTIIQQTPHIKYRTSIVVWILLALLLGLIGFGVIAVLLGGR